MSDNRMTAAMLTVALYSHKGGNIKPAPGKSDTQMVFNDFKQFLEFLDAQEKAKGEVPFAT